MTAQPRIRITRRDDFSSIWLKYVRGVDLDVHCINSLIGERQSGISLTADQQVLDLTEWAPPIAFYLCGVSVPYDWTRNAHLAFVAAEGESWEGEAAVRGLYVELQDAAPVFGWGPQSIDESHPQAQTYLFKTCRNWQFAHEAAKRLNLTPRRNPDRSRWEPAEERAKRKGTYGHPALFG
jgi:hypothetical protein